jgi:hypothetical protein
MEQFFVWSKIIKFTTISHMNVNINRLIDDRKSERGKREMEKREGAKEMGEDKVREGEKKN